MNAAQNLQQRHEVRSQRILDVCNWMKTNKCVPSTNTNDPNERSMATFIRNVRYVNRLKITKEEIAMIKEIDPNLVPVFFPKNKMKLVKAKKTIKNRNLQTQPKPKNNQDFNKALDTILNHLLKTGLDNKHKDVVMAMLTLMNINNQ